jgi:WD40 repeat protein
LCIPQLDVLISGSSDKTIHVWDIRPLLLSTTSAATTTSPPLQKLATIRRHTRPIESLVLDDSSIESLPGGGVEATFFSADSMGVVCRWVISRIEDGEDRVEVKEVAELRGHKTSVADMVVAEGGLWTGRFFCSPLFFLFFSFLFPPTR